MRVINNHEPESKWRKWRLDHRYMIREIAAVIGVSRVSISAFELGKLKSDRIEKAYNEIIERGAP